MKVNELRALLAKVTGEEYSELWSQDERELYGLIEEHGAPLVSAAITYIDQNSRSADVDEIRNVLRDEYQGQYDTPGKFAPDYVKEYFDTRTVDELENCVDWEKYATDEIHDREFIEVDGHKGVFVFSINI